MTGPQPTLQGFRLSPQQALTWTASHGRQSLFVQGLMGMDPVGESRIRDALRLVIARHEILRTALVVPKSVTVPYQWIRSEPDFEWQVVGIESAAEIERVRRIDLETAKANEYRPVCSLLQCGGLESFLLLTLSAMCADAWTVQRALAEAAGIYNADEQPGSVLQYCDYSEWLLACSAEGGSDLERSREHWRAQQISSWPTPWLSFHRRPAEGPFSPHSSETKCVEEEADSRARIGESLEAALLTAWIASLWRFTGRADQPLAIVSSGRCTPELRNGLGPYARALPVRLHVRPSDRVRDMAAEVAGGLAEARKYEDGVLDSGEASSILTRGGLAFEFEETTGAIAAASSFRYLGSRGWPAPFAAKLHCAVSDEAIWASVQYDAQAFDPEHARTLRDAFVSMARSALKDPNRSLEALSPGAGRSYSFGRTAAVRHSILDWFEEQAASKPTAAAVVAGDGAWTYQEINSRAAQFADVLLAARVKPESRIPVIVERSREAVAAFLGVMKAGCTFAPLNPQWPAARLNSLIGILSAPVAIVGERRSDLNIRQIAVPEIDGEIATPTGNRRVVGPGSLAYVLFTSGSTGAPKAVEITHGALANYVRFMIDVLQAKGRSFAHVSTLSADLGNTALFPPLTTGGLVHILDDATVRDGQLFQAYLRSHPIDVLKIAPTHLRSLLDASDGSPMELGVVVCGGEPLTPTLVRRIRRLFPGCRIINHYGPTETTIGCLVHEVPDSPDPEADTVPIGAPIDNAWAGVVSADLTPVPQGAIGELVVGGAGVARGYAHDPTATAERFLPDPFGPAPGARLYRTGDLARQTADGVFEFVGRTDGQTKIRGHRVDPNEVEQVLRAHPGVSEAAVIVTSDTAGDAALTAYFVANGVSPVTASALRAHAGQNLPSFMVPASFHPLGALPLTANGKLDRTSLLATADEPQQSHVDAKPRTETERILALIWAEALGVPEIGRHDDFFLLGGHSLLAMQVASRIRRAFDIEIPVGSLFEATKLAALAREIDRLRASEAFGRPVGQGIPPCERGLDLPLSYSQQRLWFLDQLWRGTPFLNNPAIVRVLGEVNRAALERALNAIIARHEVLRSSFTMVADDPRQVIAPVAPLEIRERDFSKLPPAEQSRHLELLAKSEASEPFDLEKPPLMRVCFVQVAAKDFALLFTIHHIVSDAWSIRVLLGELKEHYEALQSMRLSRVPRLEIQYGDFAVWQREYLSREVMERLRSYWRLRLESAPRRALLLPGQKPRPANAGFEGGKAEADVRAQHITELMALVREEKATLFMALEAALNLALNGMTGETDLVTGTDVACRDRSEIEPLIGFFVNQLVLRVDLRGCTSPREMLRRVRATALDAYAHQDLPFELLVEALGLQGDPARSPLFEIKLVLDEMPVRDWSLGEATAEVAGSGVHYARNDLTFFATPENGGVHISLHYRSALFDSAAAAHILGVFCRAIEYVSANPDRPLEEFRKSVAGPAPRSPGAIKSVRPKRVHAAGVDLVKVEPFDGGQLPLVLRPAVAAVNLAEWSRIHAGFLRAKLTEHGALLLRDFEGAGSDVFESLAAAIAGDLFRENGEHERHAVKGSLYTPVFFPPEKKLLWHNENSFNYEWPRFIGFYCDQPAGSGGESVLVDSRQVFADLPAHLRDSLIARQVMYIRSYGHPFGLDWRAVFRTDRPDEVEERCRRECVSFEWRNDGRLVTRSVRPAVARHSSSGALSWFNQAQHWHPACLDPDVRESLLTSFGPDDLPRSCSYGDGEPIPDDVMLDVCRVYERHEVVVSLRAGDMLLLDNVLTAHGRNPFRGERRLLVAMGDMGCWKSED